MDKRIHFNTIQRYFKIKHNADIEQREFTNNKTGEVYSVIYPKGTDVAVFSARDNGQYVCIDSNGEVVPSEKIIGYVNGVNVAKDEHDLTFAEKDLVLHYDGETVDVAQLIEKEKEMYPERTPIVMKAILSRNGFNESEQPFYVDEILYVQNEEYEKILKLNNSEKLKEYNQKIYNTVQNGSHGVAVINESGDGVLIDTGGSDYAKYMCIVPNLSEKIKTILDKDMEQNAIHEMKMYVPLRIVERDVEFGERYDIDGSIYLDKIRDSVRQDDIHNEKRGLAEYLTKKNICQKKVYSIKPDIERVNDVMMGVVAIKMTEPLSQGEIDDLKDYITGQLSNGWGESFEQQAIQVDGNEIYVHFWNKDEYFIKTEEEMVAEQEQEFEMEGMQGIQGMSGM